MSEYTVSRDSQRVPLETRVQLKFEWFGGFISEYSSNISPGGMFIRTQTPEPAGRLIGFELRLGDGYELIRGTGEVVWARMLDQGPDKPAGMGIRFLEISPAGRELIYQMVDNYIAQGGTPFDVTTPPAGTPEPASPAAAPTPAPAPAPPPAPVSAAPPAAPAPPESAPAPSRSELPWPPAVLAPAPPAASPSEPEPVWPEPLAPTFGVGVAEDAVPRRSSRLVLWAGLGGLLVLLTALAILKQDALLGLFVPAKAPAVSAAAATPHRRPRPVSAAKGSQAPQATEAPAIAASTPPAPASAPATAPAERPAAATPPPPQPVSALPPSPAPGASPAPATPEGASLGAIQKITWKQDPDETEVVLWGDGAIRRQDFAHYRIDGDPPRELVKLYGIRRPFASARLVAGTQQLLQVRTGYHVEPKGNELHVVLDLRDAGVEVTGIEAQGAELHIHLKGK